VQDAHTWFVVGLDNGGNKNNATVLDGTGRFHVNQLLETPSRVLEGPDAAVQALAETFDTILELVGASRDVVRAVGLDTPGPASADGVISSQGSTNFAHAGWRSFDFRGAVEARLGLPVVYNNDGNAAALYAHHQLFGRDSARRSSIAAIVGTGLGGGVIVEGKVVKGAAGFAGELGHVHIPMEGLLGPDQPVPRCNCGFSGDAESVASLTAIEKNLLPYWLGRFPDHDLARAGSVKEAAKLVRDYGERGDALARHPCDPRHEEQRGEEGAPFGNRGGAERRYRDAQEEILQRPHGGQREPPCGVVPGQRYTRFMVSAG